MGGASREGVPGIQPKCDCAASSVLIARVLMIDMIIEAAIRMAVTSNASSIDIILASNHALSIIFAPIKTNISDRPYLRYLNR